MLLFAYSTVSAFETHRCSHIEATCTHSRIISFPNRPGGIFCLGRESPPNEKCFCRGGGNLPLVNSLLVWVGTDLMPLRGGFSFFDCRDNTQFGAKSVLVWSLLVINGPNFLRSRYGAYKNTLFGVRPQALQYGFEFFGEGGGILKTKVSSLEVGVLNPSKRKSFGWEGKTFTGQICGSPYLLDACIVFSWFHLRRQWHVGERITISLSCLKISQTTYVCTRVCTCLHVRQFFVCYR